MLPPTPYPSILQYPVLLLFNTCSCETSISARNNYQSKSNLLLFNTCCVITTLRDLCQCMTSHETAYYQVTRRPRVLRG